MTLLQRYLNEGGTHEELLEKYRVKAKAHPDTWRSTTPKTG